MTKNLGFLGQTVYVSDADARSFIDAAGISDSIQRTAINTLVSDLKTDGLWSKMHAIYPFVGGTPTTHKYNLIDPQDTDGAFRITWVNDSPAKHTSNGWAGNGSTSYGNTHFQPNSHFDTTNWTSMGYYSRTQASDSDEYVMGCTNVGYDAYSMIVRRTSGDLGYWFTDGPSAPTHRRTQGSVTDGRGFFQGFQDGTNLHFYNDATEIGGSELTGDVRAFAARDVVIGAQNNLGTIERYTARQCAFAYIGTKLTATEISNYYDAVQAFQTSLGRQV